MDREELLARVGQFVAEAEYGRSMAAMLGKLTATGADGNLAKPSAGDFHIKVVPSNKPDEYYKLEIQLTKRFVDTFGQTLGLKRDDLVSQPDDAFLVAGVGYARLIARTSDALGDAHNSKRLERVGVFGSYLSFNELKPGWRLLSANKPEILQGYFKRHPETATPLARALDEAFKTQVYSQALGITPEPAKAHVPVKEIGDAFPDENSIATSRGGRWTDRFPSQNSSKADIGFSL